jgi:hypothetical protein
MADPNLQDFYGRIARIQKARAMGYGFEADGTLGRSYYYRPAKRRRSIAGPLMIVLMCGFGLKGVLHHKVGGDLYQARVDSMMHRDGFERLGGYLMQADPVTLFVSQQLNEFVPFI